MLCAGAAQGLVLALQDEFMTRTGVRIGATFGAVGTLREKLDAGEPCDVVILTAAMIAELAAAGRLLPGTSAPLGRVRTGVAVRAGDALPGIADRAQLAASLLAAPAIYVPDTVRSTAGIHVAKVLQRLEIFDAVAPRLSLHPNGTTAMRALAATTAPGAIGCTQITEIRNTPGVALVGALPGEFELATVYTAAVAARTREPERASEWVELLTGAGTNALREDAGFD